MTLRVYQPQEPSVATEHDIAVLGPDNSFSHQSYQLLREAASGLRLRYMDSMDEAFGRLSSGSDALMPTENFSSSEVGPNIDLLFDFTNGPNDHRVHRYLEIRGGILLEVRMCLGGTSPDFRSGRTVYSQEMGIKQCGKFLRQEMPGVTDAQKKRVASTSLAVQKVRESNDPHSYAIASAEAIHDGGLHMIRDCISNAEMRGQKNGTRFLWLRPLPQEPLLDDQADYHACIITPGNERGMLGRMTQIIGENGGNLNMQFHRPVGLDEHRFFYAWRQEGGDVRHMYDELESLPPLTDNIPVLLHMGSWYADTEIRDPRLQRG